MGDNLNNENSKNEKPNFVLNDIIKRKILDMYKISSDKDSEGDQELKESELSPNDNSQDN